ncbi:NADH-quinone oxidoreductase subunit NuoF [Buchnera aphidicola]|uniref:NADH-quinone oxidoreductase subunit NuoF n=1 Tax=Buchnera aphidicola TaxID=9 RepID=UPI0030EF7CA2
MNVKKITEESHPLTWRFRKDKKTIWLDEYVKKKGYLSLKKSLYNMTSKEIIQIIISSGLQGRGGAGFPTGIKWNLVFKNSNINNMTYLICNADEMEPGTYKDRWMIENCPHLLIEGMLISAFALGSSSGFIFLRGEYTYPKKILKKAIQEAYNKNILGKNIFNSKFSFDLFLHTGAGRYICGEETALINSLEGRRANPRFKPPFPANLGLWGCPTCVNNVETLCNVPAIILNGAKWYRDISKCKTSGTKLMGFSGRVKNPGVWEVPFGTVAREILEDYAQGMLKNFFIKAWLPGGAGTSFLKEKHLDLPMDFLSIQNAGSRLGTGISTIVDHTINIVSLVKNLEKFFSRESCGWCTPCREGLPWALEILKSIESNNGMEGDIKILEDLCINLSPGKTFCAHAPGAISPLLSAIKYFRDDFEKGIKYISSSSIKPF